ncbi:hypothetical protein HD806DRAFT_526955 [Xylariaceae sp. AK1471]|nr:hypothetical protein HD806DRAFT_526955 [Xylariaceae sp. AK1471]
MSRYNDDFHRGRAADADYAYSKGGTAPRYARARLTYEPQGPLYPPPSPSTLKVPESRLRPRSLPPPIDSRRSSYDEERERGYNKYGDSDDSDDGRPRTPIEKARKIVGNTFTDTTRGLGVGVLGALVGGLAAREAVDLTGRQHHKGHHDDAEHKRNQLISTVVGAAVGALGANAVEKRIENNRARDEIKQEKWERKWRPNTEVMEKREIVARPRSKGHGHDHGHYKGDRNALDERDRDDDRGGSRRGIEREVDPGARSWTDVEDWVGRVRDDDNRPRSSGQRGGDSYRY